MSKDALPTYRLHKSSGQAIVTLNGQTLYLGKHGTPESRQAYDRTIAEWLANGRELPEIRRRKEYTVAEVLLAFRKHAEKYYRRPDGTPTSEVANFALALRPVRRLYGNIPASELTPRALQVVRSEMIRRGLARTTINAQIRRIVSVFKWAVAQELVDTSTHQALKAVSGLRRGRTEARESKPVRPVPDELVDAVQPFVSRQVWAVIQLQRLTGARAGELVIMRPTDVDTSGEVWLYTPTEHKTAHHGHERTIYLGPKAQEVLQPFLLRSPESHCFSAAEADAVHRRRKHARRKTPMSCGNRPGTNRTSDPKCQPGSHYTTASYRRAITRACEKAFPPPAPPAPPAPLARRDDEKKKDYEARLTEEQKAELNQWRKDQALLKDEEWSQWSDNAIAKAAKVSPHTVKVAREHFANAKCDVRKTTDGRAMNTSNIGRKAKGPKTDAAEATPDSGTEDAVHPREEPTEASEHRTVVTRAEYETAQSPATEPAVDRTPKAAPDVLPGLSDEQFSRLCEAALELRMALQADRPVDIPADLQEASLRVCRIVLDEPEEEAGD